MIDELVIPRRARQLEELARRFVGERPVLERAVERARHRLERARLRGVHGPERRAFVAEFLAARDDVTWCERAITAITGRTG